MIKYHHNRNNHSLSAPYIIVPHILSLLPAKSVLDVGCGIGSWMAAFKHYGINDILGVDGVPIANRLFTMPPDCFECIDLCNDWSLERKFDLVVSLEVAEHIDAKHAGDFIKRLCNHSDTIVFSAAPPYQIGENHVNLQWPSYWQKLFNDNGFLCEDLIRPLIWDEEFSEYWYKQNMFVARQIEDKSLIGNEPRILSIVHPEQLALYADRYNNLSSLFCGSQGISVALVNSAKIIIKALLSTRRKTH